MAELTHFDDSGNARMVDVGQKAETQRVAAASGVVVMQPETARRIGAGQIAKGDVLGIARLAGIMSTKRTAELIPLCHPVRVTSVDVQLSVGATTVSIEATVSAFDRTGVEMEALTAVSVAALTIYDMCKSIDRTMQISDVMLDKKTGGKSGDFDRHRHQDQGRDVVR